MSTLLVAFTTSSWVCAGPDPATVDRASALYDKGRKAHARGAHVEAAKAFAEADELVPDAAALEAALVSVTKTDEAVLGMELATRAKREPSNAKLERLARKAKAKFTGAVGSIVVSCDTCVVLIDAIPTQRGVATWVRIGEHDVVIRDGEAKETRKVTVEAGAVVTILPLSPKERPAPKPTDLPKSPAPDPKPDPKGDGGKTADKPGPPPSWFWVSFAATAAVGVGALVSGVDTAMKHGEFSDEPTEDRAVEGEAAEVRTNVLLAVTGGLAVITLAVGLFVVDWDQDDVALSPNGLRIRF